MRKALTIEDVCEELVDCVNRTAPETANGSYFAVGTSAMRGNVINLSEARQISGETFARWTRRLVPREGDLLLAREAPVGPVVRIPAGGNIAAGQRTMHLRANPKRAHPRFLFYLLISPEVQAQLMTLAMGSTVPHLRVAEVKSFVLPDLPPLELQAAIQEILGALDDKIAVNDRISLNALNLAEAEFVQLSTEAGEGKQLGDVLELKYGKSLSASSRVPGKFPVYGSGGIAGSHDRALVPGPGVVVGRKGTVGAVYWSEKDFFPIDTTFYAQLQQPGMPMEFAYFMLKNLGLDSMNSDSAVPGLNRSNALALQVKIPAEEDLRKFRAVVRPLFALRETVSVESASLAELRDALLPKLMSGQIRVRDAEKVVEDAVLWAAGCQKRIGNTSSWSGSPRLGGSLRSARTSPRGPGSGSRGMS